MSLRIKFLLALVFLLGITMMALLSIGNAWEVSLRARQEADIRVLLAKRADVLKADFAAARDTLRLLAQTSNLFDVSLVEAQRRLDRLGIAQSRFEAFYLTSESGLVTPPYGAQFSVKDREYFPSIAGGVETVSEPLVSRHSGQKIIVMTSPVVDDSGRFRGAFSGSLLLAAVLEPVLKGVPGDGAILAVFDRQGVSIGFRTSDSGLAPMAGDDDLNEISAQLQQRSSNVGVGDQMVNLSLQGRKFQLFWQDVPEVGWKIAYLQGENELIAPMKQALTMSRWLLLLVLVAGVVVILVLERLVVRPVRELRDAHKKLEKGDFGVRVDATGRDELTQLAVAFNRAVAALGASEGKFAAIFDAFPHPVVLNRMSDGRYLAVNAAFERMSGFKKENALGMRSEELNPSIDAEESKKFAANIMARGAIDNVTISLPQPDGSTVWVMYSSRLVEIEGELCALSVTSDITELKLAEKGLRESQANLLALFEKAPIPMSYSPYQEGIPESNWNESWYRTFGYPLNSCEGQGGGSFGFWASPAARTEFLRRLQEDGLVTELTATLRHANGSDRLCEVYGSFIESQGKKIVLTTYLDVTDRRYAENALRASQFQLEAIFNASPVAMVVVDRKHDDLPRMVNRAWCQQFGFDETQTKNLQEFEAAIWKYPQERQGLLSFLDSGEEVSGHEALFRRANGEELLCSISARQLVTEADELAVLALQDITDARAALVRLAESKTLVDSANDGMLLVEGATIIDANPAAIALFGGVREDVIGHSPVDLSPAYQPGGFPTEELAGELIARALCGETLRFEWLHHRREGSEFVVEVVLNRVAGHSNRLIAVLRDVTEQQAVRHALESSEARYRRLNENMLEGYAATGLDGKIVSCNQAFCKMLGYDAETLAQLTYEEITPTQWHEAEVQILKDQVLPRGYSDLYEKEYRRSDGRIISVELRTYLERDADEAPIGYWALVRDITERKRSEAAADLTRRQLVANLENTPAVAVQWYDADGRVLYWNPASQAMYGFSADEMVGSIPVGTLFDEAGFAGFIEIIREIEVTGQPYGPYEIDVLRRDGRRVSLLATTFAIPMARNRVGFVCMDVDITSRKEAERCLQELNQTLEARVDSRTAELAAAMRRLELANAETSQALASLKSMQAELVRSEKMAGLGALVAGVAHELNTPIGNAVMVASTLADNYRGFSETMQGPLKRSTLSDFTAMVGESSQILMRNLERAAHLVSSFKQVAVDQSSYQRRRFDLREVVDEISLALAPSLRHSSATLSVDVPEGISLDSYPGPLGQVLMNLINNAMVHAYGDGASGVIFVRAEVQDGSSVMLSVGDQGKGIPAEHISRVFDPFFTTRLGQGGSGLGLNIVYNLVTELLGGSIDVSSELGKGTVFTLKLPLDPEQMAMEQF